MIVLVSEEGSVVIDGERAERDVEVESDALSFLKGRARAFALFCTFFFRDTALPEREDFTEAVDLAIGFRRFWDNTSFRFRRTIGT
jgi:hypothetical protein